MGAARRSSATSSPVACWTSAPTDDQPMTGSMAHPPPSMTAEERELFASSLRQATGSATGEELDRLIGDIGWADALATDPRAAVSTLFELQGAWGTTSSALGTILLDA